MYRQCIIHSLSKKRCLQNPLYYDLNADSLAIPDSSPMEMESACIWLLLLPSALAAVGSSHCWECSNVMSELSKDWAVDRVADWTCFVSMESCNERRHTGQVDCFLSHISMQDRWKLWPHLGIILNISLSWYSAKHIVHLQFENNIH